MTDDVFKTNRCMWCGQAGGPLKLRRSCFDYPHRHKFECVDGAACEKHIKSQIIKGP